MEYSNEISSNPGLDVVRVIIQDNSNRVLLVREVDDPKWKLPGGKIEKNESVYQALTRELLEELGITSLPKNSIKTLFKAKISNSDYYRYIARAQIDINNIQPTTELSEIGFFDINQLPKTKFLNHIQTAYLFIKQNL